MGNWTQMDEGGNVTMSTKKQEEEIMNQIETGKTYTVSHSRKGRFDILVADTNDEWTSGKIVKGTADALCHGNIKETGESITVRNSFCHFKEIISATKK